MKRYSLANYILSIEPVEQKLKTMFGTISIGGEGSYVGSVNIAFANDMFTTNQFATGAWTHDKNLNRSGTTTVALHQLADEVIKFIKLCKVYYTGDYAGCRLSLSDAKGNEVASCEDCYIQKFPDQNFAETSENQSWTFTCGCITLQ